MSTAQKKKRTLQDITDHMQELLWRIDDNEGVLEDGLEEELDSVQEALAVKVNAVLWVTDQQEAMADKMKARADALTAKSKSIKAARERLREYVLQCLRRAKIDKMSTRDYPVVAVYNSPDKAEITNEAAFMLAYQNNKKLVNKKVEYKPIMAAVKADLVEGKKVTGAVLLTNRKRLGVK